jgi:DNA repair protein RadC
MRIRVRQTWKDQISNPEKVSEILRSILATESEIDRDKEHIWVLGLSTSNVIRYIDLVSLGTLDMTLCEPREVFRLAVMKGVKAIIVAHNHPSGVPSPSTIDSQVTKTLADAGKILGIKLLDAIIVTNNDFWSASAAGMI